MREQAFTRGLLHPAYIRHTWSFTCAQLSASRLAYRGQRPGSGSHRRRCRTSHSRRRRRDQPRRAWSAPRTRMRAHKHPRSAAERNTSSAHTHTPGYGGKTAAQQARAHALQRPARSSPGADRTRKPSQKRFCLRPIPRRRRPLPPARPAASTPSRSSERPHGGARQLAPRRAAAPIAVSSCPGHGAPATPPRTPHAPSGRARADADGRVRHHTHGPCHRRPAPSLLSLLSSAAASAHRCCVREDRELTGQRWREEGPRASRQHVRPRRQHR